MKHSREVLKKLWKKKTIITYVLCLCILQIPSIVFAKGQSNGLSGSALFTGIEELANDLTTVLVGISLAVGIAAEVYQFIKLQIAEPEEASQIRKKQKSILAATVGATLVSAILKLILNSYFGAKLTP